MKSKNSNNYINFSKQIPGKWIRNIKSKNIPGECCWILEIREIDNSEHVCLIKREFSHLSDLNRYNDELVRQEPYNSDEDLKKFEMYNE